MIEQKILVHEKVLKEIVYEHFCDAPCDRGGEQYVDRLFHPQQGVAFLFRPICAVTGTTLVEVERRYE